MSYAQFGLIEASDYNTLAGGNPVTSSGRINTVWATGGGSAGYGQTALANVSVGSSVLASNWANLVNTTANAASHQGTSITSVTAPSAGNTITFNSAISTNLTTIYNNRLNAAAQGGTSSNTVTRGSSWSSSLTFSQTVTFVSGDAARYFFNAGGQLAITCSHSDTSTPANVLFNGLASNIGTVILSSPTSGTVTIASTSYNGVTKIGGGGNSPTISSNNGYYALTTANANVFTQTASTGPGSYLNSFIRIIAVSNGTQGSNSDAGSIITLYTVWDLIPDGLDVSSGSATTLTVRPPSTTYIANTWGAISLSGSVSGS
jgi:hypothetical protein